MVSLTHFCSQPCVFLGLRSAYPETRSSSDNYRSLQSDIPAGHEPRPKDGQGTRLTAPEGCHQIPNLLPTQLLNFCFLTCKLLSHRRWAEGARATARHERSHARVNLRTDEPATRFQYLFPAFPTLLPPRHAGVGCREGASGHPPLHQNCHAPEGRLWVDRTLQVPRRGDVSSEA